MSDKTSRWLIVFYTDRRGRSPVVEFLNGLSVIALAEKRMAEILEE